MIVVFLFLVEFVIKVVGLGELQVETVAQFGVVFLLFALGLEFSMSKVQTFHLSLEPQFKNQNFRFFCVLSQSLLYIKSCLICDIVTLFCRYLL
jgi:Kef-type K+ transport system membrane component KefB